MTQEKKNIFHANKPTPAVYDEIFTAISNIHPELDDLINLLNKAVKYIHTEFFYPPYKNSHIDSNISKGG